MKLSILVQSGSLAGQRREIKSGTLTVGREPNCGLPFDLNADRLVSKRHAYFQTETDGFYIIDAGSTNGTFVNGARITKQKLNSGDVVRFGSEGGPQIAVTIEQPQQAAAPVQSFAAPAPNYQPQNPPAAPYQPPMSGFAPADTSFSEQNYDSGIYKSSLRESLASRVLFNPEIMPLKKRNNTGKYIFAAAAVVVGVVLSLIVLAITLLELGPIVAVIATIVAFAPVIFYLLPLLWLDRYDPEPPLSLALAFAWGALVAVVFSFVVNTIIGAFLGQAVAAVVSAPVFEEGSKGLALVLILLFWRKEFDGIVDGIVYAGVIALGFAAVENVLYYGRHFKEFGVGGLALLFVVRGVLSPFAHVIFTAMTGIGCGIARETHIKALRFIAPVVGYIGAVVLHAIWNAMPTFGGPWVFLIGYALFEVPFFCFLVIFAGYLMRRENKILKETLQLEVAKGVITSEQMEISTSITKSVGWLFSGILKGKIYARHKFLRAVAKVGLAWWHVSRAQKAQGETRSFQLLPELERDVLHWRSRI